MSKRIIGYGICGDGEAGRYMRATMEEFKRLCDEVYILCNNCSKAEEALIDEYGFHRTSDRRQWGYFQWRIKQDFLERDIKPNVKQGDVMVCLDMDEVFDKYLTREWLLSMPMDAYHVYVVDLWGDGYKPESCFFNVRIWRWNGKTDFKAKPVHCGLAPEWAYLYHRFAPFILKHYGLKDKKDRERRIERYKRFDPDAKHLSRKYYDMLKDDTFEPFDEEALHKKVADEVATYKQSKPKQDMFEHKPKGKFVYVRNPAGLVVDIPVAHLEQTLKRPGFELVGDVDEAEEELGQMFDDVDVSESEEESNIPETPPEPENPEIPVNPTKAPATFDNENDTKSNDSIPSELEANQSEEAQKEPEPTSKKRTAKKVAKKATKKTAKRTTKKK